MESSSEYESSFIDDTPVAPPQHRQDFLDRLKREEKRYKRKLAEQDTRKRVRHQEDTIERPAWKLASTKAETTASKKLRAALSGVLDRSTCDLWEKRGALFDAINNHPATRKPLKKGE